MCSQKNIQKHRIMCKISDTEIFLSFRSPDFKIGDSGDWFIEWFRSNPAKPYSLSFALCGTGDEKKILNTTFYLLSDEINHIFENESMLQTKFSPPLYLNTNKVLLCAIDVACDKSVGKSVHWIGELTPFKFQNMNKESISEIANMIERTFSDSLLSEHSEDSNSSVGLSSIHNNSPTPAVSTTPAAELMFKCFKEKKFCDITIQVAGGHNIFAHKIVLLSRSTVWQQLLTDDDQLSVINVTEFDAETIDALLTFIYINSVPEALKSINLLLIAAETFGVGDLKTCCEQRLIDTITKYTAINLLVLAHRYNAKELFDCVLDFVRNNIGELKESDEWKMVIFQYPEFTFELLKLLL